MAKYAGSFMTRVKLKNDYVKVVNDGKIIGDCGGNQDFFKRSDIPFAAGQGCGMVAAIDVCLYLNNTSTITLTDYILSAKMFIKRHKLSGLFLREIKKNNRTVFSIGIIPAQICKELNDCCRRLQLPYKFKWYGLHGHKNLYEKIKQQLENDIPVIWSIYAPGKEKLALYKYDDLKENYFKVGAVNNHYMTIVGLTESATTDTKLRMLEVSSWGKKYYINFDEYLQFEGASLINKYCSNIVYCKRSF